MPCVDLNKFSRSGFRGCTRCERWSFCVSSEEGPTGVINALFPSRAGTNWGLFYRRPHAVSRYSYNWPTVSWAKSGAVRNAYFVRKFANAEKGMWKIEQFKTLIIINATSPQVIHQKFQANRRILHILHIWF